MSWEELLRPAVVAAIVSGVVSFIGAAMNRATSISLQRDKLKAESQLAERKFEFDKDLAERKFLAEQKRADWLRRNENYQSMIKCLPALSVNTKSNSGVDDLLNETRKLWIIASPDLIRSINSFEKALQTGCTPYKSKEEHLGALIMALREDVSLDNAGLTPGDFEIRTANLA